MCIIGSTVNINGNGNISYLINPNHRIRNNPNKSYWLVTPPSERDYFVSSINNNWIRNNRGWGIYSTNGVIDLLGIDRNREESKIGIFVTHDNNSTLWHGYPYERIHVADKPPNDILLIWRDITRIIRNSQMRKIKKGLLCNL